MGTFLGPGPQRVVLEVVVVGLLFVAIVELEAEKIWKNYHG